MQSCNWQFQPGCKSVSKVVTDINICHLVEVCQAFNVTVHIGITPLKGWYSIHIVDLFCESRLQQALTVKTKLYVQIDPIPISDSRTSPWDLIRSPCWWKKSTLLHLNVTHSDYQKFVRRKISVASRDKPSTLIYLRTTGEWFVVLELKCGRDNTFNLI